MHQVLPPPLAPLQLIHEVPFQTDYIYSKQALLTHCGVLTGFVTKGRAVDVCRDFSKAFDTGSHGFLHQIWANMVWMGRIKPD